MTDDLPEWAMAKANDILQGWYNKGPTDRRPDRALDVCDWNDLAADIARALVAAKEDWRNIAAVCLVLQKAGNLGYNVGQMMRPPENWESLRQSCADLGKLADEAVKRLPSPPRSAL